LQHQQPRVAAVRRDLGRRCGAVEGDVAAHGLHDRRVKVVGVDASDGRVVELERVAQRAQAGRRQALQQPQAAAAAAAAAALGGVRWVLRGWWLVGCMAGGCDDSAALARAAAGAWWWRQRPAKRHVWP
jgi:hypothetical protein